ncbi:MAG: Hsp20/alpha crystallin family protein [Planctomycetota bacterium]|nr:Hsp20/alpha crystallin family protein [Planctomycetota bacterium]
MLATRSNFFRNATTFQSQMDRLFSEVFGPLAQGAVGAAATGMWPALNAWETDDSVVVEAELPGYGIEDVEITLEGNALTLKGAPRDEQGEDGSRTLRRERRTAAFERTIVLPVDVNPDGVGATLKNGVLTVTLAKAVVRRPVKVQVNAS